MVTIRPISGKKEGKQMIPTWAQDLTVNEWAIVGEAVIMLYDNCYEPDSIIQVDKDDLRIIERLATAARKDEGLIMEAIKEKLKTIAEGAKANGTSIDAIVTEFINAPSEYDGDGGIWTDNDSGGYWWDNERKSQFIEWNNLRTYMTIYDRSNSHD